MQGSLEDLAGEAPLFIALESYFKQVREWAATAGTGGDAISSMNIRGTDSGAGVCIVCVCVFIDG